MKSVQFDQFGEPRDVLRMVDGTKPMPSAGQALLRMLASPVNPSDLMTARGQYTKLPTPPFSPGYEGVGIVEEGGGLLGRFLRGKRVAVLSADGGCWQEYNVAPARQLVPIPRSLTVEQAAMFFVNPTTAYVMTQELLKVQPGAWLLQSAGGSAVGRMVIRLGRKLGFKTISIVRRAEQAQELKSLGGNEVLSSGDGDIVARVKQITAGVGVPYAIDCVGGRTGSDMVRCLAPGGRMVLFGTMSGEPISFSNRDLMTPAASLHGFWLGNFMSGLPLLRKISVIRQVSRLLKEGVLNADVGKSYPLDQVREAVVEAERPGREGKVLLQIAR